MGYSIGIDLGGSTIKVGILSPGRLLAHSSVPALAQQGLEAQLPVLTTVIERLLGELKIKSDELLGVGLAFAGLVDSQNNRVLSTNKKYDDAPALDLTSWAQHTWGIPLLAMNDARMALLGEWHSGAGQGYSDLVLVTLGTGIGTAVILDNQLLVGKHFQAGNLGGHFVVQHRGHTCTCRNLGCAEAEASTWALPRLVQDWPEFPDSPLRLHPVPDFKTLFALVETGDSLALKIFEHCISVWSATLISLIHAYDPEVILLSGGLLRSADLIIPRLEHEIFRRAWTPWGQVKLRLARHTEVAALYGADYLIRSKE